MNIVIDHYPDVVLFGYDVAEQFYSVMFRKQMTGTYRGHFCYVFQVLDKNQIKLADGIFDVRSNHIPDTEDARALLSNVVKILREKQIKN